MTNITIEEASRSGSGTIITVDSSKQDAVGVPGEKWVYYTYRKDGSGQTGLRVELLEAGQSRQYWSHPDVSLEWKQARQRITVDINDWSDLQLRFIVNPVEEGDS